MKSTSLYLFATSLTAALGGFLLGFDGSVISGAIPFYQPAFGLQPGSFALGFSVSCIIWGSILGNILAGPLSDRIGRKRSLLIAALLFTANAFITAMAGSIGLFILGRIIGGLGVGIAILVAPVYIAELAPARSRGWLVSLNQLLIVTGLSAAYFSNYIVLRLVPDPAMNWRWMLGISGVPALIYFFAVLGIPESPRWLMLRGMPDKAEKIVQKIGGVDYARVELASIRLSLEGAADSTTGLSAQLKEFFSPAMRRVALIGFGLAVLQQFSGINAILYYAPMVFESTGGGRDAAFLQAVILGIVFLVMTVVSMFLIDRLGRKSLLYIGVSVMAGSLTVVGFLFRDAGAVAAHPSLILTGVLAFIGGFSISLGPVMWALLSEIFPNRLRGTAISVVGAANALASFLVATFFPLQLTRLGSSNTYFIYAFCMFFCLWFVWRYVVETKGRTLEQLEKELLRHEHHH